MNVPIKRLGKQDLFVKVIKKSRINLCYMTMVWLDSNAKR